MTRTAPPPVPPPPPGETPVWHRLSTEEALAALTASPDGLSPEEAQARLVRHGPNELEERGGRGPWQLLLGQFASVIVLVLIAAAVVSALIGSLKDALVILAIVVLNAVLGFVQEYRAERAIAALRQAVTPVVRVRRGGQVQELPSRDLVPGDLVLLEAGNLVPADGRLIEAVNLRVQEAALTGESEAVDKETGALAAAELPVGDRANMAFLGTTVTAGRGGLLVTGTGMGTELGRIAELLQTVETEQTPLQRRLDRVGKTLALAALGAAALVFVLGLWRGENVRNLFLTAVSVAVAAIPEGLTAVVTIALALGAQRMLRRRALIRKLPAVETLGSVTTICSDKTGTLTENRMTVTVLDVAGATLDVEHARPEDDATLRLLLAGGTLCNDATLSREPSGEVRPIGDPTETALVVAAERFGLRKDELERDLPRVREEPFDSDVKRMTTVHRVTREVAALPGPFGAGPEVSFVKGSVDGLLNLARAVWVGEHAEPLTPGWRARVEGSNAGLASRGLRVLGLCVQPSGGELTFVGLFGMIDPARPEVRDAVATARGAGVRPVMITGDHPLTALAIARDLGIAVEGTRAVTGEELGRMGDAELRRTVREASVYARVSPEHKLRIVEALQAQDEIVAMTGDGVNDAPALRKADIGLAMGITGTDVTKEASDMVLLDDNFATIVAAVEEGRVIYDNVRKFIRFSIAGNLGKVLVVVAAPILLLSNALLPIQLLWLNLLTDGLLGLGLSVEGAERGTMRRPPILPRESIFARGLTSQIVTMGLFIGLVTLALGYFYYAAGREDWGTVVFTALAFAQVGQALTVRTDDPLARAGVFSNRTLLWLVLVVTALQLAVLYVPFLRAIFETRPLPVTDLLVCAGVGVLVVLFGEATKLLRSRRA